MGYKKLLRDKFEKRKMANPRYSLRAFARDIRISPSRLSEILNGKQGLSESGAEKISSALGMEGEEKARFILQVVAEDSRSKHKRRLAKEKLDARAQDIEPPHNTSEHHFVIQMAQRNAVSILMKDFLARMQTLELEKKNTATGDRMNVLLNIMFVE